MNEVVKEIMKDMLNGDKVRDEVNVNKKFHVIHIKMENFTDHTPRIVTTNNYDKEMKSNGGYVPLTVLTGIAEIADNNTISIYIICVTIIMMYCQDC